MQQLLLMPRLEAHCSDLRKDHGVTCPFQLKPDKEILVTIAILVPSALSLKLVTKMDGNDALRQYRGNIETLNY